MAIYRLEEMFPDELERRMRESPVLVVPFGTIEWHSHHLPLGLDGLVAREISERIADRLDGLLAPVSYWAVGGVPYPYTLNLPITRVEPLLEDVLRQYGQMGFEVIVAFTGHFGLAHTLALKRASLTAMRGSQAIILPLTEYDLTTEIGYLGDHAAMGETSLMMSVDRDLVRLDSVPETQPLEGIIGEDPRKSASLELGRQIMNTIVTRASELVSWMRSPDFAPRRKDYLEALEAGIRVLEEVQNQRDLLSKEKAPPLMTRSYIAYCQAMSEGDYPLAATWAREKLNHMLD